MALTDFIKNYPDAPDPFNLNYYIENPDSQCYLGARISIFDTSYRVSNVLHFIKLLNALKRYHKKFTKKSVESFDHLPLYEKALKLTELLRQTNKYEILNRSENSDQTLSPFFSELKELLQNEITTAKEQIGILANMPQDEVDWRQNPGSKVFFMEIAEDLFCDLAVKYNYQFTEDWENYSFDPECFNSQIPDVLFPEFARLVKQVLQPLNFYEQKRILDQSLVQFNSVTAEKRRNFIFAKYEKKYWSPNPVPPGPTTSLDYLFQIFPYYEKYYSLFQNFIRNEVDQLKENNTAHPALPQPRPEGPKPKSQSFDYIHKAKNPEAINDLFKDLKDLSLLHPESSIYDFKRAFTNGNPVKPIRWTGSISELHFFIKCIHNQEKKVVNLKQRQWEAAQNCFVDAQGNPFDRNKLKNQKDPVSANSIRNLIQNL